MVGSQMVVPLFAMVVLEGAGVLPFAMAVLEGTGVLPAPGVDEAVVVLMGVGLGGFEPPGMGGLVKGKAAVVPA